MLHDLGLVVLDMFTPKLGRQEHRDAPACWAVRASSCRGNMKQLPAKNPKMLTGLSCRTSAARPSWLPVDVQSHLKLGVVYIHIFFYIGELAASD